MASTKAAKHVLDSAKKRKQKDFSILRSEDKTTEDTFKSSETTKLNVELITYNTMSKKQKKKLSKKQKKLGNIAVVSNNLPLENKKLCDHTNVSRSSKELYAVASKPLSATPLDLSKNAKKTIPFLSHSEESTSLVNERIGGDTNKIVSSTPSIVLEKAHLAQSVLTPLPETSQRPKINTPLPTLENISSSYPVTAFTSEKAPLDQSNPAFVPEKALPPHFSSVPVSEKAPLAHSSTLSFSEKLKPIEQHESSNPRLASPLVDSSLSQPTLKTDKFKKFSLNLKKANPVPLKSVFANKESKQIATTTHSGSTSAADKAKQAIPVSVPAIPNTEPLAVSEKRVPVNPVSKHPSVETETPKQTVHNAPVLESSRPSTSTLPLSKSKKNQYPPVIPESNVLRKVSPTSTAEKDVPIVPNVPLPSGSQSVAPAFSSNDSVAAAANITYPLDRSKLQGSILASPHKKTNVGDPLGNNAGKNQTNSLPLTPGPSNSKKPSRILPLAIQPIPPPALHTKPKPNRPLVSPMDTLRTIGHSIESGVAGMHRKAHAPSIQPFPARTPQAHPQPAPSLPNSTPQSTPSVKRLTPPRIESPATLQRLYDSRDPRLHRDKRIKITEKPTPVSINVTLCKGDRPITTILLKGDRKCYHKDAIETLVKQQARLPNHLHIVSYVSLKTLNELLYGQKFSLMDVVLKGPLVDISKLKSFLQVNEMAGVAYDPQCSNRVMVLMPVGELHKVPSVPPDNGLLRFYHQLCAIYIDHVDPRPNGMDITSYAHAEDYFSRFSWERIVQYFCFPPEFQKYKHDSRFVVEGQSENATILSEIAPMLRSSQPKTFVMMFDRYNQTIFSKKLTRHKMERATILVEFGVPDLTVDVMIPPEIVFPYRSGGFVTTDAKNMLHQPSIINTICDEVEKLNMALYGQGTWRFVLPSNFLSLIKSAIESPQEAEAAQDVVVRLTVALSQSKIDIVRHWSRDTQHWDTVRFMDMMIRSYYKTFEFFAIVDEIESVPKPNRPCHIDFVSTQTFVQTFL